jgi:alpha-soluble NSF attachment protein
MDDNNNYNQAKELIKQAEIKIKGSCCSNLFKSYNQRRLEALDNYEKAANLFKLSNKWKEAGETYETVAEIKENDHEDGSSDYEEAAFCYGKFDLKSKD